MSSWANAESSDEDEPVEQPSAAIATTASSANDDHETEDAGAAASSRDKSDPRDRDAFAVCVSNLSYNTNEDLLGDFFHDGGCRVKTVKIPLDHDGKPRGFGFVEFEDRASAELALKANAEELNGRRIKVEPRVSRPRENRRGDRVERGGAGDRFDRGERRDRGDRGDRGDRYDGRGRGRDSRPRTDEPDWVKGELLADREPREPREPREQREPREPRENQRDRDSGRGRGRGRRDHDSNEAAPSDPSVPATRPKLNLLPRKVPLDSSIQTKGSIFGEGKPREATDAVSFFCGVNDIAFLFNASRRRCLLLLRRWPQLKWRLKPLPSKPTKNRAISPGNVTPADQNVAAEEAAVKEDVAKEVDIRIEKDVRTDASLGKEGPQMEVQSVPVVQGITNHASLENAERKTTVRNRSKPMKRQAMILWRSRNRISVKSITSRIRKNPLRRSNPLLLRLRPLPPPLLSPPPLQCRPRNRRLTGSRI
jgi:RNA recognition motif-containing protein